jgi:hypothetical protein
VLAGLLVSPAPGASAGHAVEPYFDLDALPVPDFNGKQIYDGLKQFVNDFPYRVTGTPNEIRAGMFLYEEMKALGYEVETCSLAGLQAQVATDAYSICNPDGIGAGLKAIVATKRGTTKPDESIMLIGHYDSVPRTIYGAYDNGAGSNFIRFMAEELANVPTNRSVQFVWYNGEEQGLLASELHAKYLKDNGAKIAAVLGFDMVGIGFPVATPLSRNCMCMFHGADDAAIAQPLLSHVNYDYLGFPGKGQPTSRQARLVGNNTRNSDEQSFNAQGYLTLRWAGMRTAADYVAYHLPDDTIETIDAEAGGATYYEQGVENTLKSVYYSALALDNHLPVPAASATKGGLSVAFDGSGSTDEDGALSAYTWDFGDGTTGEGVSPQHTYSAPGTYDVTLTLGDNLWPQVTRSVSITVTVS